MVVIQRLFTPNRLIKSQQEENNIKLKKIPPTKIIAEMFQMDVLRYVDLNVQVPTILYGYEVKEHFPN